MADRGWSHPAGFWQNQGRIPIPVGLSNRHGRKEVGPLGPRSPMSIPLILGGWCLLSLLTAPLLGRLLRGCAENYPLHATR
ncbi:MAG: hypothetical protein Fur0037_14500 [Planctomycetota bacterium]